MFQFSNGMPSGYWLGIGFMTWIPDEMVRYYYTLSKMTSLLYLSNLTFGNQTHFHQFNIEPVYYSGDLNTQLVQHSNGQKEVECQMQFEYCPDHFNTVQMDAILLSYILVWYLNRQSSAVVCSIWLMTLSKLTFSTVEKRDKWEENTIVRLLSLII